MLKPFCLILPHRSPFGSGLAGQDMAALDGDGGVLKDSAGNKATRDIVQFVPISKYPVVSAKLLLGITIEPYS